MTPVKVAARRRFNHVLAWLLGLILLAVQAVGWIDGTVVPEASLTLSARPSAHYRGKVALRAVRFDEATQGLRAALSFTTKSTDPKVPLKLTRLSLQLDADGSRRWFGAECDEWSGDHSDGPGLEPVDTRHVDCGNVLLTTSRSSSLSRYPFDAHGVTLQLAACANTTDCSAASDIDIADVSLAAEGGFVPDSLTRAEDGSLHTVIRRPRFARMIVIVFLGMALVFLVYLVRVGDKRELFAESLGFIGTLWAIREIIVPESIPIFPTVVDLGVLTLFGTAFAVILHRLKS